MELMKIDLQILIYSCDQVKVTTLADFPLFPEKIQDFYERSWNFRKIISREQIKQKIMKERTFATLRRAQKRDISSFPQIMVKFTKFHELLVNY